MFRHIQPHLENIADEHAVLDNCRAEESLWPAWQPYNDVNPIPGSRNREPESVEQ